ncbi:hypothetical protein T07_9445 [Trichinella nelsoni]|uniref:DUF5641 domain-containing protein n=1 Tax=Trichinella nelsoni TaxID=6336 RepID=A0A0V0RHG2_9BILA|nr:hypothetical protein T07_9445 [Trichinella nelsoni]
MTFGNAAVRTHGDLSSKGKWKKLQEQPRIGGMVLVADYNIPRHRWPLGQVIELLALKSTLTPS